MSSEAFAFVAQAAEERLTDWGLSGVVGGQTIARLVADGTAYWQHSLPGESHLALIRLFSPVARREEVFLGNVLLNDFLSKALIRAGEGNDLGHMVLLANDLENYHCLYHGRAGLDELAEHFHGEVLASLPELYFGDEDPAKGIYGDVGRMLAFYKSNIEPFPAFAVPRTLLPSLLHKVSERLHQLAAKTDTNINVILALLSFFYARDGTEMQSPYAFLDRAMREGLLPASRMRAVLALDPTEEFDKDTFADRKKGEVIDRAQLQDAIDAFLSNVQQQPDQQQAEAVAVNLASKMPALSASQTADMLRRGLQLGFLPLTTGEGEPDLQDKQPCRFCGADAAVIVEKNITGGFSAGRFYNQSPKVRPFEEALCGRCGVSGYLTTKLLGMHIARPQPKGKDYPVPKQYNIVFHYGRHGEAEAQQFAAKLDGLLDLLHTFQQKAWEEKRSFSVEYIREEMAHRAAERQVHELLQDGRLPSEEEALAALIADGTFAPALDTLGQMRRDVRAQVLSLGVGDYRLLAFILPQLQPGRSEALDFVQRRFSRSRLAAFTLLSLLRKLCGCDGPYYFQSVPTLAPGGFDANTFYVQGKAENANEVLRKYGAIVNFARRVVKWREGHSLLADWILLAERLEEEPLETFSKVVRDSPLRRGDDLREAQYKRLSSEFVKGTGVIDGTEYLKLIEQLRQLGALRNQGGEAMPRQVNTTELDEFCQLLFRTLDRLGGDLLPLFLSERPTSYEKYPRLLLGHMRYNDDVEAGFEEWKNKVLRDASDYRREKEFPELLTLKAWLVDHRSLFEGRKDNLNHLKRSLYARAYQYLYPRRLLTGAYAEANRGNPQALEEDAIRANFRQIVQPHIAKLTEVYGEGERLQTIVAEAEDFLIINRHRYRWKL